MNKRATRKPQFYTRDRTPEHTLIFSIKKKKKTAIDDVRTRFCAHD